MTTLSGGRYFGCNDFSFDASRVVLSYPPRLAVPPLPAGESSLIAASGGGATPAEILAAFKADADFLKTLTNTPDNKPVIDGSGQIAASNMRGTDGANTTTPATAAEVAAAAAAATLADGSLTAAKFADDAITADKIDDGALSNTVVGDRFLQLVESDGAGSYRLTSTAVRLLTGKTTVAAAGSTATDLDQVSGGGGGTPVDAIQISNKRTWYATDRSEGYRATNIITLQDGFTGTLQFDFGELTNPETTLATLSSVTLTHTDATTVTATNLRLHTDRLKALFDVPALTKEGTYTVKATVTTADSQTLPCEGTLQVK